MNCIVYVTSLKASRRNSIAFSRLSHDASFLYDVSTGFPTKPFTNVVQDCLQNAPFRMNKIYLQDLQRITTSSLRQGSELWLLKAKARSWPEYRSFNTGGDKGMVHESDFLSTDEDTALSPSIPVVPRSKKLSSIIRDGVVILNQTASTIQSNAQTTKSLFTSPEEKSEPNPKQLAEEHRIFETAQKCLEDLCTRDPTFPLMAGEEPILLLGVHVKPSFTHADLYWSLPFGVLSTKELNDKQREFLKVKMSERVDGAPGRMLLRQINSVLSNYYPPKIRLKEAPPLLVHQLLHDLGKN